MMHGVTWAAQADAFLDELNRRDRDRQDALDALTRLCRRHPFLEDDTDMCQARMALLR